MISFLTDITVDGVALWVVLLICVGVFLGAFMDAIAGGGGSSPSLPISWPLKPSHL